MERSSELIDLSEWDVDNLESVLSEEISESGFLSLNDDLGWGDNKDVGSNPRGVLGEGWNLLVLWLRGGDDLPAVFDEDLLVFRVRWSVWVSHAEVGSEEDVGGINMHGGGIVDESHGVESESEGLELSSDPVESSDVGGHRDAAENIFSGSGEVSSIEDDWEFSVVLEGEAGGVELGSSGFDVQIEPGFVVHIISHGGLWGGLPEAVWVIGVHVLDGFSVGEDFEITVSSGHGGLKDDVSESDQGVSWAGGAILVWDLEEWGLQSLAEIEGLGSVDLNSVLLQDLDESFELFIGTINDGLVLGSQWVIQELGEFFVLDGGVV